MKMMTRFEAQRIVADIHNELSRVLQDALALSEADARLAAAAIGKAISQLIYAALKGEPLVDPGEDEPD